MRLTIVPSRPPVSETSMSVGGFRPVSQVFRRALGLASFESPISSMNRANPWLWQLQRDLSILGRVESCESFVELFKRKGDGSRSLILDDEIRQVFCELDCGEF